MELFLDDQFLGRQDFASAKNGSGMNYHFLSLKITLLPCNYIYPPAMSHLIRDGRLVPSQLNLSSDTYGHVSDLGLQLTLMLLSLLTKEESMPTLRLGNMKDN